MISFFQLTLACAEVPSWDANSLIKDLEVPFVSKMQLINRVANPNETCMYACGLVIVVSQGLPVWDYLFHRHASSHWELSFILECTWIAYKSDHHHYLLKVHFMILSCYFCMTLFSRYTQNKFISKFSVDSDMAFVSYNSYRIYGMLLLHRSLCWNFWYWYA